MRRTLKAALLSATIGVFWPGSARADGFISPWAGINFANDPADGRTSLGVTAGAMGGGVIGAEFDLGYSPSFFGTDNVFGSNSVITAMGNIIVGIPFGGSAGPGVRPYVTGGLGLIRSRIDLFTPDTSNTEFGVSVGGGVMGFFTDHFGLRADLRYFRTGIDLDVLNLENVDFWRASFGVVIR
jgi:opacity protein-like surface antigen